MPQGPARGMPHCWPYSLRLWFARRLLGCECPALQRVSAIRRGLKRYVHARFSFGLPRGARGFEGEGTFYCPPPICFFGPVLVSPRDRQKTERYLSYIFHNPLRPPVSCRHSKAKRSVHRILLYYRSFISLADRPLPPRRPIKAIFIACAITVGA